MFDPKALRPDFPILETKLESGKPLVYLDSAATSQKPKAVLDAIISFYAHDNANVHRGLHELGDRATRRWHESRATICKFFGSHPEELVMTRNATEGLNMVAYAWGDKYVKEGDLLLATELDHHSNLVPLQELAKRRGARLELIPATDDGQLDLNWLSAKLNTEKDKLRMVALPYVSNTLGTIVPVKAIERQVRAGGSGAVIVLDAAQAAPHLPVNFAKLNVDFMAISAHKMLGPMGVGGLFVRHELLSDLEPWLYGGGMIGEVYDEHATYAVDVEDRFTAGTPDVAGAVGWAAACDYLTKLGMEDVAQADQELVKYALEKLKDVSDVILVGPKAELRCGSVTFLYKDVHAHDVAQVLSNEGIAVRSGHHCTMPLHQHMGWAATTRVSFNVYTTKDEIDALVKALEKVNKVFA